MTGMKQRFPSPEFAWLLATAVAYYYAKWPPLILAAIVGLIHAWLWFCRRFPMTACFVFVFLRALLGGRRR